MCIRDSHASFELKEHLRKYLENKKDIEVIDLGTYNKESTDYPDYAKKLGEHVSSKESDIGIAMCGTGLGMSIAVNKVKGIRGALCLYPTMAEYARKHNNANVLVMAGRLTGPDLAEWTVDKFLETEFEGGRHKRRVDKISSMEDNL